MKLLCGLLYLLILSSCNKPTYLKEKLVESVKKIAYKEYKIENLLVKTEGNTLCIYMQIEKLIDQKFELDKEALEKIRNILFVSSRILFSSDSTINIISLTAFDQKGIELKMVQHIDDIKKRRVMYISSEDYLSRSDINFGFNPEVLGRKTVNSLYSNIIQDKNNENVGKYLSSRKETLNKIPTELGNIHKLSSLRIEKDKSLIYIETKAPDSKLLFLIDVSLFDILKELFIIYLNKDTGKFELPIITDCWNLEKEEWPQNYKDYEDLTAWKYKIYTMEIKFEDFIAQQIKRKIKKRFNQMRKKWKIRFKKLDVIFKKNVIYITREISKPKNFQYNVNVDHEIGLLVAKTIKSYQITEIDLLNIRTSIGSVGKLITRKKLLKLKQKRWKKIVKRKKLSLKEFLNLVFSPFIYEY